MIRHHRLACACLIAAMGSTVGFAQYKGSVPPPRELKTGFDSITQDYAKQVLHFLATECEGRGSGQPGFQKAADFVAAKFKEFGLRPMGDNGTYFQNVEFNHSGMMAGSFSLKLPDGTDLGPNAGSLRSMNTTANLDANTVLVEYPEGAKELPEKTDFTGKIVILSGKTRNATLESAADVAGAVAVLSVVETVPTSVLRAGVGPAKPRTSEPDPTTYRGYISREALAKLVSTGVFASKGDASTVTVTEGTGKLHLGAKYVRETVLVPNVVGLMVGTDPTLKGEYVGIGGHLDHLGTVNGVVYPGADDDGSGSTAVISVARAMSMNPQKPRRSILFMTFCGEEMGLIGSGYLSDHSPVPLEKMVAELQMDMVARDSYGAQNGDRNRMDVEAENHDTIRLVGSKRISTELHAMILEANKSINFKFKYDAEDVYTRSDHYNFAKKGIPIAFLFDGFTPSYHQPTDVFETINFEKLVSSARLYYLTLNMVANRTAPPKKDVGN